jgi:hypothetical protein
LEGVFTALTGGGCGRGECVDGCEVLDHSFIYVKNFNRYGSSLFKDYKRICKLSVSSVSNNKSEVQTLHNDNHNFSIDTYFTPDRSGLNNMIGELNTESKRLGNNLGLTSIMPTIESNGGRADSNQLRQAWENMSHAQDQAGDLGFAGSGYYRLGELTGATASLRDINAALTAREQGVRFENFVDDFGRRPSREAPFADRFEGYDDFLNYNITWFQTSLNRARGSDE